MSSWVLRRYYVEGSNPAIIEPETFEKAQALSKRRRVSRQESHTDHFLHRKIVCGCCGATYRRQKPRNIEKWTCNSRYENSNACDMPSVSTEAIEDAFCRLYYKLKHQGEPILSEMISAYLEIKSRRMLWSLDVIELNKRIADLTNQNQLLTMLKQQGLVDSDLFISRSNAISEQLRKAKQEKNRIMETSGDNTVRQTQELIDDLSAGPDFIAAFDGDLFNSLVGRVIVEDAEHISFQMKNGLRLNERIERMKR